MTRPSLVLAVVVCFLSSLAQAVDVSGKVQWNNECKGIHELRSSKVILDNGRLKSSIKHDGTFTISNVPNGTYILSVLSQDHTFDQLRIDVVDQLSTPEVRTYVTGTPLNPPAPVTLTYPIKLIPKQRHAYFVPPDSFNLVGMLSNPMMLMMVAAGFMMFVTPYLMKNMDPEAMEEFKEQHAKVQNAMSGKGLSGLLSHDEGSEGASTSSKHQASAAKSRGGKGKRR